MAKINLDIGHALSREDQRQNRRNLNFVSQPFFPLCFSPESARRSFQKKINRYVSLEFFVRSERFLSSERGEAEPVLDASRTSDYGKLVCCRRTDSLIVCPFTPARLKVWSATRVTWDAAQV